MRNTPIDIVILWVDGNDPKWKEEKRKIEQKWDMEGDFSNTRYRDWGILKYWFRSIEKNIPWYNNIFFVTCGQYPSWLDLSCPRLRVVNHEDFMRPEDIPTFNSNAIEVNLHRIKDLSENFILFNDDMFVVRPMKKTSFFLNDKPCDEALLDALCPSGKVHNILSNNMAIINNHFNKTDIISIKNRKWFCLKYGIDLYRNFALYPWKRFSGIYNQHLPIAHKKSTFYEVWEKENDILKNTSSNRVRSNSDVSHWLFRYWRLVKGEFTPIKISGQFYTVGNDNSVISQVCKSIITPSVDMICINDSDEILNFSKTKKLIIRAFEQKYPHKSVFER